MVTHKKNKTKRKVSKFVFWTPRILSIVFILFLTLFSLDVFGNGLGFWETALALLMHNIPSIILLVVLLISWKHEIVGAIAFSFAGLLYCFMLLITISMDNNFEWYMLSYPLIIAGPAILIGILFWKNWIAKKRK